METDILFYGNAFFYSETCLLWKPLLHLVRASFLSKVVVLVVETEYVSSENHILSKKLFLHMQVITLSTKKICDDLRDLVSFLHSKKCGKHP